MMTNKPIYALSIKQPYAWLICKGIKDIENRTCILPKSKKGIRIYIHAGKTFDIGSWSTLTILTGLGPVYDGILNEVIDIFGITRDTSMFGAIIGEVDIVNCVTNSNSPWFWGKYGFVLSNPVLYEKPIPYRGQLGFFKPNLVFTKVM